MLPLASSHPNNDTSSGTVLVLLEVAAVDEIPVGFITDDDDLEFVVSEANDTTSDTAAPDRNTNTNTNTTTTTSTSNNNPTTSKSSSVASKKSKMVNTKSKRSQPVQYEMRMVNIIHRYYCIIFLIILLQYNWIVLVLFHYHVNFTKKILCNDLKNPLMKMILIIEIHLIYKECARHVL
jgi:hypothetical protein